jgi:hypothetical protein
MEDTLEQRIVYNQPLDHFYTKNMGSFNTSILNHFLHHLPWNNGKDYMLRYAPSQEFKEREITADIINQHLNEAAFKEAVIRAITSNGTQGHSDLKKIEIAQKPAAWLIFDPEKESPISLTSPSGWTKVNGSIITLECGSIWDHLGPTSVLHLADSNIPFDPNTYVDNSVISMDDTLPPPAPTILTIPQTLPTPQSTAVLITPIKQKTYTLSMKTLLPCPPFLKVAAPDSTTTSSTTITTPRQLHTPPTKL